MSTVAAPQSLIVNGESEALELRRSTADLNRVPERRFLLRAEPNAVERVVLERYDALAAGMVDGKPYSSQLDLPRRSS